MSERTASLATAVSELYEQATKRQQAEEELVRLNARQELDRITNDFVSTVSHEFRTPLTALTGFTELLLAQDLATPQQRTWIQTMHRESGRLSHLVEELLDLTRIEEGRIELRRTIVVLEDVIESAIGNIVESDTGSVFHVRKDGPLRPVDADPEKLIQILTNLFSNAVKYSPEGGDVIVRLQEDGAFARVSVQDHGLGMEPAEMSALFGRFSRSTAHADRGIKGNGLGLFITKRLVEIHGGQISAESAGAGQGSTFSFTIPFADTPMTVLDPECELLVTGAKPRT